MSWWTASRLVALAAVLQVGLLSAAAIVAWAQVREARRLRRAQAQPYVVISLETDPESPSTVSLAVANLGATVAHDVTISISPTMRSSLDSADAERVNKWTALSSGVPTLVPGQKLTHFVDSLRSRYSTDLPGNHRATVSFVDDDGKSYTYNYDLDFQVWLGSHYTGRKGVPDLVAATDKIASALESARHREGGFAVAWYDGRELDGETRRRRLLGSRSVPTRARGAGVAGRRAAKPSRLTKAQGRRGA